jgi:hypothetical protein
VHFDLPLGYAVCAAAFKGDVLCWHTAFASLRDKGASSFCHGTSMPCRSLASLCPRLFVLTCSCRGLCVCVHRAYNGGGRRPVVGRRGHHGLLPPAPRSLTRRPPRPATTTIAATTAIVTTLQPPRGLC